MQWIHAQLVRARGLIVAVLVAGCAAHEPDPTPDRTAAPIDPTPTPDAIEIVPEAPARTCVRALPMTCHASFEAACATLDCPEGCGLLGGTGAFPRVGCGVWDIRLAMDANACIQVALPDCYPSEAAACEALECPEDFHHRCTRGNEPEFMICHQDW